MRDTTLAFCLVSFAMVTSCATDNQIPAVNETVSPEIESPRSNLVTEGIPQIPTSVSDRLRQYQNIREHGFRDWGSEGILIGTRFGDVTQIHSVKAPGAARRQLTFFDEPVSGADMSPTGDVFVFTRDTGGDEYYQGYVFQLGTGEISSFTEPGTRNGATSWSDDGAQIAWYQAKPETPDWDVLIADVTDPTSRRVVFGGNGVVYPVDWAADGQRLVVQQLISDLKSRLFVVDLQTGNSTEINPSEDIAYSGAELLANGDVITATDRGSETKNLVRILAGSDAIISYTDNIPWDVADWIVSPDEKTLVFTLNENGLGPIKILDLDTGAIKNGPDLPTGIASSLVFHPNGRQVGFTFDGPTSGADAWSFDLQTRETIRWTQAEVGGLNTATFVEPTNFEYPNAEDMQIPAFIYRPDTDGPYPVIISIHGGPEAQARPYFSSTLQYWANELGLAVIVPNVRGSTGYGKSYLATDDGLNRKRSVEDIGALLDWIAEQDDLDSDRVLVHGGSYGGYMVYASLIDYPDRLAGGISIVGISDFTTFLTNTNGYRRDLRRVEYGDERDPKIAAFFDEISPLNNASRINKPIFIIQGANDPRVPVSEAQQILEAIRQNGGEPWYLLALDEGHGFRKKDNIDYQRAAETLFIAKTLGLE
ncbi:MAG: alpha/beta fold hydrolase [Pseudomonadota bacterium]